MIADSHAITGNGDPDVQKVLDSIRRNEGFAQEVVETDHWLRGMADRAKPDIFYRGDHKELAEHLRHVLAKEKLIYDLGEIWRYRANGLWSHLPNHTLRAIVSDLAGTPVWGQKGDKPLMMPQSTTVDATKMLDNLVLTSRGNKQFHDAPAYGLGFQNGFLTIVDGQPVLLEHSPNHLCRFAYDFAYAPQVEHPMLDKFFKTVFRGESLEDQRDLPKLLQEFVGACLFGKATAYEKVLVLWGTGGNGKSQFLEIARSIFPPGSVSALAPQRWGEPFSVVELVGKLANFVDEIPEREISSGAVFKAIVSGQMTWANRKNRDGITFCPTAGQIFSANTLFGTTDTSEGFYRRFLVVPFHWKPLAHESTPEIGKTIARMERRALVTWAIQGYCRLLAQGEQFTKPGKVTQTTETWKAETDYVRLFSFALFERHAAVERFSNNELYKMYCLWCDSMGIPQTTLGRFLKRARDTHFFTEHNARGERGLRWATAAVEAALAAIGNASLDWGTAPDMPRGAYASYGYP